MAKELKTDNPNIQELSRANGEVTIKEREVYNISVSNKNYDGISINKHIKKINEDGVTTSEYVRSLILQDMYKNEVREAHEQSKLDIVLNNISNFGSSDLKFMIGEMAKQREMLTSVVAMLEDGASVTTSPNINDIDEISDLKMQARNININAVPGLVDTSQDDVQDEEISNLPSTVEVDESDEDTVLPSVIDEDDDNEFALPISDDDNE